MTPETSREQRGRFSSFSQKLELGLGQLKQRAVLGVESVRTRLAPIKQKGVKMARATREMSFLTKVEVGIAAIGVVTAMTELIHAFPYAVGLEDPKEYHPLVIPAVLGIFENMFPPVSSVGDSQVPIPTLVQVTPEGTPLFVGVFPPGTAVVEATGVVITVTPMETATEAATETPEPIAEATGVTTIKPDSTSGNMSPPRSGPYETDEPKVVPTLELSEYGQQLKFESRDIIKAFKIIGLKGRFPGPYGDYWYYTATDGAQEWTVAIFANHYNPDTGIGSSCIKGNCWNLPGKVVDVMYLSWIDDEYSMKEFYDPEGELHEGKPYIYASGLIVHK